MQKVLAKLVIFGTLAFPALPAVGAEAVLTVVAEGERTALDWAALDALPQTEIVTGNDYITGVHTFTGPRLSIIFGDAEMTAEDQIKLTALNDYAVTIPASDALTYPVILATRLDGARMAVRDKGPIWVIYPMKDFPELHEPTYNDRLIWQLSTVELVPPQ